MSRRLRRITRQRKLEGAEEVEMPEQKTDQIRKRLSKRSPGSNMVFDQYSVNRGDNQAPRSDISPRYGLVRVGIAPTPETRAKPSIHKP
jgi:hypothetical protein